MKTMKTSALSVAITVFLSSAFALAQEPKMVQFQMAILKKGPKWDAIGEAERNQIRHQHLRNVIAMLQSGKAVAAGPFGGDSDLTGLFILRAASPAEAKTWVDADPAVKAGLMISELHPWWSEDIFGKAIMPLDMKTVYFGFLKKGANRKDDDDKLPEVQELQKAHLANINRLAGTKQLVMAGPFADDAELRGVFVFRVDSLKAAQDLAATDPMIKIDRLKIELHPWQVPVGIIP
jgi:uncharacterized protein YciI